MNQYRLRPLLIFTGKYTNEKRLDRIGVENTSLLLEKGFFGEEGLNIPSTAGKIIKNSNYVSAYQEILSFIQSIDDHNDVAVIYYCGHGFYNIKENSVSLAFSDTTYNNWSGCALEAHQIIDLLKENFIRNYIVILDCCHSGYLCDMGVEKEYSFEVNDFYTGTEGAVIIASTQADDLCNQVCIEDNYYLPFSYYFAQYLLKNEKCESEELSVNDLFRLIRAKLELLDQYPHECNIQTKGDLGNHLLFKLYQRSKVKGNFEIRKFFDDSPSLRVLLVKTAIKYPISKYDDFGVPLGLWMLKDELSVSGYNLVVDVYDERLELRKYDGNAEQKKKIKESFKNVISSYDVIGISICSCEVPPAIEKFKIAKSLGKITFCGGIFTSSNEEYLLETGVIDYVVPGVATKPLAELLGRLCQQKRQEKLGKRLLQVDGIASKEYFASFGGAWTTSQLPTMRKAMWIEVIQKYQHFLNNRIDVYTARGCDKNCAFCSVQKESKQQVIRKKEESVIEEIKFLKRHGFTYFSFKDEDFLSKPDRMLRILEAVRGEGIKFKIRSRCDAMISSGITLEELSRLGVDEIQYGIESPELYIRKAINKGYVDRGRSQLVEFICSHEKNNITANCSFILGISGEDSDYYDSLLDFIKSIYNENSKPKIYINFFTPHPFNSKFSNHGYSMVTKDLNFFTHKYPVCFAAIQHGGFTVRKKMLATYDAIVDHTESGAYNPKTSEIPTKLKQSFLNGTSIRDESLLK